ncbi:MAG: hypothetical protein OEM91_15730 [Hyphomicrobiales bacterium]|nr:hypothetical protein [Hyphomicrobiales bacterium]
MNYLIDDNGNFVQRSDQRLNQLYGLGQDSRALPEFLIRNSGYIELVERDQACLIKLTPARTGVRAYHALIARLRELNPSRVALSWYDHSWRHELLIGRRQAMRRLAELMLKHARSESLRHKSQNYDIGAIVRGDPLMDLVELWKAKGGTLKLESAEQSLADKVDARYLVVGHHRDDGTLKFQSFGPGLQIYSSGAWKNRFIGQRVEDQPDTQYGKWIAEGYREAMVANEPRINKIDAVVTDPIDRRQRRMVYMRLTLPIQGSAGNTALLSASRVERVDHFDVKTHHEIEDVID